MVDTVEARNLQKELAQKVIIEDKLPEEIKTIGGADIAYKGNLAFATCVVLNYSDLRKLESKTINVKAENQYMPTYLAFREAKPIITAYKKLEQKPDILMVDGQGIAHPFRIGLASHIGVLLDIPTIGVAKSRLIGEVDQVPETEGEWAYLVDGKERIGAMIRTKLGSNPLYVSPGHKISIERAVKITLGTTVNQKIPEPLRLADLTARKLII